MANSLVNNNNYLGDHTIKNYLFLSILMLVTSACNAENITVPLKEDSTLQVTIPKCPEPIKCADPIICPAIPAPVVCPTLPALKSEWTECAKEGGICKIEGPRLVRYGVKDKWIAKVVLKSFDCHNPEFGDPAIGVGKACELSSIPVVLEVQPIPPKFAEDKPLVFTKDNEVITGLRAKNTKGVCVTIKAKNVTLKDSEIGPCLTQGVMLSGDNFTMQNVTIKDTGREGIYNYHSDNIKIEGNKFENNSAAVRMVESTHVQVIKNSMKNMLGNLTDSEAGMGNMVQFDKVHGAGNLIKCNVGFNEEGKSKVEDNISVYGSKGTKNDPIVVENNTIEGGGPGGASGGILLGDGGGAWQVAKNNIVVNPGQYGIAIAGGENNSIIDNKIYGEKKPWSNVGIYVWNQYEPACNNPKVTGNKINWINKAGVKNAWWNHGNCGAVDWSSNKGDDATLTKDILKEVCK